MSLVLLYVHSMEQHDCSLRLSFSTLQASRAAQSTGCWWCSIFSWCWWSQEESRDSQYHCWKHACSQASPAVELFLWAQMLLSIAVHLIIQCNFVRTPETYNWLFGVYWQPTARLESSCMWSSSVSTLRQCKNNAVSGLSNVTYICQLRGRISTPMTLTAAILFPAC